MTRVRNISDKYKKNLLRKRTYDGRINTMYSSIKSRCANESKYKNRNIQCMFEKTEFVDFIKDREDYKVVFEKWKESGYEYRLIPTVDRIDSKGHYELNNIQILSQSDNSFKGQKERIKKGRGEKRYKTGSYGVIIEIWGLEITEMQRYKKGVGSSGRYKFQYSSRLTHMKTKKGEISGSWNSESKEQFERFLKEKYAYQLVLERGL